MPCGRLADSVEWVDLGEASRYLIKIRGPWTPQTPHELRSCLSEWDDRRTRVCWKGDGQHFAISYLESQSDDVFRKIRVFTRDGTLFSTSEDVSGLEQPLAWRPSGL
jgi:elongator complex protein 1